MASLTDAQLDQLRDLLAAQSEPSRPNLIDSMLEDRLLEEDLRSAERQMSLYGPRDRGSFYNAQSPNPFAERYNPEMKFADGGKIIQGARKLIRALHSSPHDFEKFDSSKIGTGEGAQVYGHGLYFAENPQVADHYRAQFKRRVEADPTLWKDVDVPSLNADEQRAYYDLSQKMRSRGNLPPEEMAQWRPLFDKWKAHKNALDDARPQPWTYEVDINQNPEKFLPWNSPMPAAEASDIAREFGLNYGVDNPLGQGVYTRLGMKLGSKPAASDVMRDRGFPGVVYPDAFSRFKAGETPTNNYVLFPGMEDSIDIKRKFADGGSVGGGDGGQYTPDRDYGYEVAPEYIYNTPPSHADTYPAAQVYADGGAVEGERFTRTPAERREARLRRIEQHKAPTSENDWLTREFERLATHPQGPLGYGMETLGRLDNRAGAAAQGENGWTARDYFDTLNPIQQTAEPGDYVGRGLDAIGSASNFVPGLRGLKAALYPAMPMIYGALRAGMEGATAPSTERDDSNYRYAIPPDAFRTDFDRDYSTRTLLDRSLGVPGMSWDDAEPHKETGKVSKIIRAVRDQWGNFQGERAQRAADEVNLDSYGEKNLMHTFNPKNSGMLVGMPTDAFQDYAPLISEYSRNAVPYPRWSSAPRSAIKGLKSDELTLDNYLSKMQGNFKNTHDSAAMPSLWLARSQTPGMTDVVEHEGRHRMMALDRIRQPKGLVNLQPVNEGELRLPLEERIPTLLEKYFPKGGDTLVRPQDIDVRPNRVPSPMYEEPFADGGKVVRKFLSTLRRDVPGKPDVMHLPGGGSMAADTIPELEDIGALYAKRQGNEYPIKSYPTFDEDRARRVAAAFDDMQHDPLNPQVKRSYEALIDETMDQYKELEKLGYRFSAVKPGENSDAAYRDAYPTIVNSGTMKFFPTDAGFGSDPSLLNNPLLRPVGRVGDVENAKANDAFRVVHDMYGHFAPGNPFFDNAGEERAFYNHARMFSKDALPALGSETRGQNLWVSYGPHGDHNRAQWPDNLDKVIYAPQKAGIMPEWAYDPNIERKSSGGSIDDDMQAYHVQNFDVGGKVARAIGKHWRTQRADDLEKQIKELNKGVEGKFVSPDVDPKLQSVDNPQRIMYPRIYSAPDDIIDAARKAYDPDTGKESAMYRLFGHTRQSLDELAREGRPFDLPRPETGPYATFLDTEAKNAVAPNLTNPRNEARIKAVLERGIDDPDLRTMRSWYEMNPMWDKMRDLGMTDKDMRNLNTRMAVMSPQASPASEVPRGFMANHLLNTGRGEDFARFGGLSGAERYGNPDVPADMLWDMGHMNHRTHMAGILENEFAGGLWPGGSNKVIAYDAASDPVLPLYHRPVADSHWSRMVGLPDVRTGRTPAVLAANATNSEYATLAPWWRSKIADPLDERARDAQALAWGLFGPSTGVRDIGQPKLEIVSNYIDSVAKERGWSPEYTRDKLLTGEIGGYSAKPQAAAPRQRPMQSFPNMSDADWNFDMMKARGGSIDDDMLGFHVQNYAGGGLIKRLTNAIKAYHGSPHDFDKFDASRIGTGEGNQSYGHGLYFAENPETAKAYRDQFPNGRSYEVNINADPRDMVDWDTPFRQQSRIVQEALGDAGIADLPVPPITSPLLRRTVDNALRLNEGDPRQIGMVIDNDQSMYDRIRRAMPSRGLGDDLSPGDYVEQRAQDHLKALTHNHNLTGGEAHRRLTNSQFMYPLQDNPNGLPDLQKRAASYLNEAGIPGIRYLDEGSRYTGDGTRNYVMFPGTEPLIDIKRKYAKGGGVLDAVERDMLGYQVMYA